MLPLLPAELLTFLLFTASTLAAPAEQKKPSVWHFEIDNGPAPPPDSPLSPPGAARAFIGRKYLKFEIIGIAGAYLVWLAITFVLLLSVGLKLRRRAQSSNGTLSMEMLRIQEANEKALPANPGPLSPGKMASLKSWATRSHKKTPSNVTSSTIDTRLVAEDKARNADEMAKLYAHVMAQEEARERGSSTSDSSPSSPYNQAFYTQPQRTMPTPPLSPQEQYPPELQHLRQGKPHPSESPYYYPPPQQDRSENISQATTRLGETPRSFSARHERVGSSNSNKLRPSRVSVRGKSISEPIGDADLSQSFGDNEATPLSPRLYTPGPAPPTPGRQAAQGLPMSPRLYNPGPPPPVPSSQDSKSANRRKQTPGALSLGGSSEANSSTRTLPFRQVYQDALKSAPPTKTTFVNIRESVMGRHPKTGVPQTPYSPYQPMTPMTPVTPSRLVSKKEMKRERKQNLHVLSEDDMVKNDADMWS
ncbi:uncharacterized protein HMPREF1541_02791 [Cyphellophora europaea CBS 101466]|uniref:Uncharacterized protein n=1 Tax=Cyphellophora europaea (strain CBS 101466) TaxID=1220924 RepID=W2S4L1_CYPE1|nr:uncharacterized protein HMPREF1541_02791 [Cyphellophora europaea CBS 101466]ETN43632.1 hypothetical protein HMPREF1541_02791 [Cyphellophora europaea CBS 101466]